MVVASTVATAISSTGWSGNSAVAEDRMSVAITPDINFFRIDRTTVAVSADINLARRSGVSVAAVSGAGVGFNSGSNKSERAERKCSN